MKEQHDIDETRAGGIQVIARASAIMRTLGEHPKGLSLAAIAQQVGLARSTVQRIVAALESEALVEPIRPGTGFRLGPAFAQMVHMTHVDIVTIARKALEELSEAVQESVILSCMRRQQSSVIDRVVAEHPLRVVFPVGQPMPMHATADGKVFMSTLTDREVSECLGPLLPRLTPHTVDLPGLLAQLTEIRRTGIAFDHEESITGISACSILVPTFAGPHAVAIVAPTARFTERADLFIESLHTCKASIMALAGGG